VHLAGLTPVATPGTSAEIRLRLEGVPGEAFVQVVLRQRVRSRTEFERSVEGAGLRGAIIDQRQRVDALPVNPADGSRAVSLLLDPAVPGGFNLTAPGAYPLQVRLLSPDNDVLAELVTHLVVGPRPGDPAPALAVALTAELGASPAVAPDGTVAVAPRELQALARLAGALAAVPDVPVTLDVVPETVDALAGLDDETAATTLGSLRRRRPGPHRAGVGRTSTSRSRPSPTPACSTSWTRSSTTAATCSPARSASNPPSPPSWRPPTWVTTGAAALLERAATAGSSSTPTTSAPPPPAA
jgi:hypothetical protein